MRLPFILPALLLQLSDLVSSAPIVLEAGTQDIDIWIRKSNTLNATTWRSSSHSPYLVVTATVEGSNGEESHRKGPQLLSGTRVVPHGLEHGSRLLHPNAPFLRRDTNGSSIANGTQAHVNGTQTHQNGTHIGSSTNTTTTLPTGTDQPASSSSRPLPSSAVGPSIAVVELAAGTLALPIVNNSPSKNMKVYISGLDSSGALIMLGNSGSWEYPTTTSAVPQPVTNDVVLSLGAPNTTTTFTLPTYIESARIWIAEGGLKFFLVATPNGPGLVEPASANPKDPNAEVNYAFAELSWAANSGLYADITNVDFVGLPLGIQLVEANNTVQTVLGTPSNAAPALCNQLKAQAKVDGKPWQRLCAYRADGSLLRVMAPSTFTASAPDAFGGYFSKYVNQVWEHYSKNDLVIDTQTGAGNVTCRVQGAQLQCNGDNRGYAKPNSFDIFGCNTGPFSIQAGDNPVHYAVVPRLCAAFNRATLLVDGGNFQPNLPPSRYYRNENRPANTRPKNWYSELVHTMEVDGRGYAFSYDDVSPSGGDDQSGLVSSTSPRALKIIVGGT